MWTLTPASRLGGRGSPDAGGHGRRMLRRRVSEGMMFDMATFTGNHMPRDLPYVGSSQESNVPLITPSLVPMTMPDDDIDDRCHGASDDHVDKPIALTQTPMVTNADAALRVPDTKVNDDDDAGVAHVIQKFSQLSLNDRVQKRITNYFPLKTSLSVKSKSDGKTKKTIMKPPASSSLSMKRANKENIDAKHVVTNANCISKNNKAASQ